MAGNAPFGPLTGVVTDLAGLLGRGGYSYAFTGAIAATFWGVVRATEDVDVTVAVERVRLPSLVESLGAIGCQGQLREFLASLDAEFAFRPVCRGVEIEIFVPFLPWQHEALRRRVRKEVGGAELWVMTAEDLAVFKTVLWRPKDVADLAALFAVQGSRLDREYLRRWMDQMLPDGDPRFAEVQGMLERYSEQAGER